MGTFLPFLSLSNTLSLALWAVDFGRGGRNRLNGGVMKNLIFMFTHVLHKMASCGGLWGMVKLTGYAGRNCESEWRGMFICSAWAVAVNRWRHRWIEIYFLLTLSLCLFSQSDLRPPTAAVPQHHRLTENHLGWLLRQTCSCSDVCIVEVPSQIATFSKRKTPYLRTLRLRHPLLMFLILILPPPRQAFRGFRPRWK